MKKFFVKSLYLVLPISIFLIFMEYNLGKVLNYYNYKRTCLEQQLDSIEVLVVGSSQPTYGVNPDYFCKKGFNLSNVSQSLFYDTRLTMKYLDRMPKLKYVIINISYFTFGSQLYDGIEAWRDYYYSQFWNIDYPELEQLEVKRYSKIFLYTPATSFSYLMKGFDVNLIGNLKRNGFYSVDIITNNQSINNSIGYDRVKLHDAHYHESRFKDNVKDLEMLVQNLKKRGIIPVIVTPPVLPTYSKFVNAGRVEKNTKAIENVCLKYECRYFNYFTDRNFVPKDFADNDHLNCLGAAKFSKMINQDILRCKADSSGR
jgi:hypothetical protein